MSTQNSEQLSQEQVDEIKKGFGECTKIHYKGLVHNIYTSLMGYQDEMFGQSAVEIYHSAVMMVFEKIETDPSYFTGALQAGFDGLFISLVRANAGFIIGKLRRSFTTEKRNESALAIAYGDLAFGDRMSDIDKMERRDVLDSLTPSYVTLLRCLEDGDTVLETCRKVGIRSISTYYKVVDELKKTLEEYGYESGDSN